MDEALFHIPVLHSISECIGCLPLNEFVGQHKKSSLGQTSKWPLQIPIETQCSAGSRLSLVTSRPPLSGCLWNGHSVSWHYTYMPRQVGHYFGCQQLAPCKMCSRCRAFSKTLWSVTASYCWWNTIQGVDLLNFTSFLMVLVCVPPAVCPVRTSIATSFILNSQCIASRSHSFTEVIWQLRPV
jgi:hypothetical protein